MAIECGSDKFLFGSMSNILHSVDVFKFFLLDLTLDKTSSISKFE